MSDTMRFWLTFAILAPLLMWQAHRARRDTPRLPEAGGADHGVVNDGTSEAGAAPLRLLVVGESTAAGVGVREHQQGLGGQLARALHARLAGPIAWRIAGVNGIRAHALADHFAEHPAPAADLVVISLGVNDTTGLTNPTRYQQDLAQLIARLRGAQPDPPVALLAVPPMQHFTALPRPLRDLLGARAGQLDRAQQTLAARLPGVHHLAYPAIADPTYLAEDGYHPGEAGYTYIAEQIAEPLASLLR